MSGRRVIRMAVAGNGDLDWVAGDGVRLIGRREDYAELEVGPGLDPQAILREAVQRGEEVTRFEIADPTIEEVFIEHVGAAPTDERTLATAGPPCPTDPPSTRAHPEPPAIPVPRPARRPMSRPTRAATARNVVTIARREYTWRGRSRSFAISTIILVVLAVGVALAPVVIEAIGRSQTADRIAVYEGSAAPSVDIASALESLLDATASRASREADSPPRPGSTSPR